MKVDQVVIDTNVLISFEILTVRQFYERFVTDGEHHTYESRGRYVNDGCRFEY
uniref:Uncharacterized protein n=1 Tax=uncultured Thiotrichaceae bacterium TaxID=298394 RepID=A0A6S6TV76_9GAMM|nr:MAG: Unknown protein [uncultured Thiotrichaceae bacterium]